MREKIQCYNQLVLPYHLLQAFLAAVWYRFPARKLKVIGVTGTNGKTTTSFMIWKMLTLSGRKTGLMTTVGWGVSEITPQVEHMTTASAFKLNKRMREIADSGAEYLVLEVTSHALVQFRTLFVPFSVAVMTNVTHEHLDYHGTFEKYRDAKRRLFKKAEYGIVNADDESSVWFLKDVAEHLTYGINDGVLQAREIKVSPDGVAYRCGGTESMPEMRIRTQIPGRFNVYNSLAAVGVGLHLGLSGKEIASGIQALEAVEGRMNRVECGQDFGVIVDYAHTPDAFLKVFESIGEVPGRVIALFGGAGRRDETTRFSRGEIGGREADVVIITEDDSRDEDPLSIAEQFVEGAKAAGKVLDRDLFVELDREKAIRLALSMAAKGDLVLVLGKGHEKTILRADGAHEFEDLKVVEKVLGE